MQVSDYKNKEETPKKKQGRPLMTEPKKDKRVVGYLTEDEYTSLKEEAKRRDINIATLVRIAILNLITD